MNRHRCRRSLGLAALALLGCKSNNDAANARRPDATVAAARDAAAAAGNGTPTTEPPPNLLLTLRGTTIRRALPLMFPEAGGAEVMEQLSRQITPGIADHGDEIDVDSPFAVAGTITGANRSTLTLFVAWPLRPGMQVAIDARAERGYRRVSDGVYRPSVRDAGSDADHQCWVAQRAPAGWMLLCGPAGDLPAVAGFLRSTVNAPENTSVIDLDVRAALVGELAERQLRELDNAAPPPADPRRAAFDEARRGAALFTNLATGVDTFRGSVTQDTDAMHLRAEMVMARPSSENARTLVAASAGRSAPADLVRLLPDRVRAWVAGGFDRAGLERVMGEPTPDPGIARQSPQLARVMSTLESFRSITPLGERVDAYSDEDGYTVYHLVRRADAARWVSDLRIATNSIPTTRLPDGSTFRDVATILPTPGLTGDNYLRIGRRIPAGAQIAPEIRAELERSTLFAADGDHVTVVVGRDPVARYRAMAEGPRLAATIAPNSVMAGHVTAASFTPLFYGARVPQLGEPHTTDPLDFVLSVERRGEGARAELRADAPIAAALEIRTIYAMIQVMRERAMQQMQQMMQQQQQQQQQGGPPGGMMRPRPQGGGGRLTPDMLPPPPNVQLQPPQK